MSCCFHHRASDSHNPHSQNAVYFLITMWHTYHTPASLDEALGLLARYGADARVIAGGTDMLIEIERGLRNVHALIDISRIGALDTINLDAQEHIHLGPLVTHNH